MITGVVAANHEATIPLVIHGAHGRQETIDAVIDTGFTGSLTLPPCSLQRLGCLGAVVNERCDAAHPHHHDAQNCVVPVWQ
jgi:predicted aspartyl protease